MNTRRIATAALLWLAAACGKLPPATAGLGDEIARAKPASFFSPSYNTPAQPIVHKDGKLDVVATPNAETPMAKGIRGDEQYLLVIDRTTRGFIEKRMDAVKFVPLLPGTG